MDRREFLEKVGAGAALALALTCLSSCTSSTTPSGPVDFTIDLRSPTYSTLSTKGNYVVINDCVVAFGFDGVYYAATVICSHEGERKVRYDPANNNYYCSEHGARYSLGGSGLNSTGAGGLTTYTCELSGSTLRVHS